LAKTALESQNLAGDKLLNSCEEKGVIELKHDIARLQKKQQEELTILINEITQHVREEFEQFFIKKYDNQKSESAKKKPVDYEKLLDQLNFWRTKRQLVTKEREYAENNVSKEELDIELKFIDKRIETYSTKCERIKKKTQQRLDEIKQFREKELKELYESIKDFLLSREENQEGEENENDSEEEEDEEKEMMEKVLSKK